MGHCRSGARWVCATVAPWALGVGLLVSFTASAGHDPQSGTSAAMMSAAALGIDIGALVPLSSPGPRRLGAARLDLNEVVREARLRFDLPEEAEALAPTTSLKPDMKGAADGFPSVDRTRKGDPVIALRPSLSRQGSDRPRGAGLAASRLLFGFGDRAQPVSVLVPGPGQPADLEPEPGFFPYPPEDTTTTEQASAAKSPAAAAAGSTGAGRSTTTPSRDGSTPAVPRAVALASTTPAAADATPIEIAAAPVSLPALGMTSRSLREGVTTAARTDPGDRPRYADLISPEKLDSEQRCLAEAVYFEARSEPAEGQAAVAQVVLNRVKSGLYPASVCGVVYQNRHRHLACQFTFTCEGKSLRITDGESWASATRVAQSVLEGKTYLAVVGGATHYHADYVRPRWARRLKKMDVIGRHIFYKLKPGQT